MVKAFERVEFVGQIMDVIEDVLDKKGVRFDNTAELMKDAGYSDKEIEENDAVLFGENYDEFADQIAEVLVEWGVLEE